MFLEMTSQHVKPMQPLFGVYIPQLEETHGT